MCTCQKIVKSAGRLFSIFFGDRTAIRYHIEVCSCSFFLIQVEVPETTKEFFFDEMKMKKRKIMIAYIQLMWSVDNSFFVSIHILLRNRRTQRERQTNKKI